MQSSVGRCVRRHRGPLILALLILVIACGGDGAREALAWDRGAILHGQWWRVLSNGLVHLGPVHTAINLAGLLLLVLLDGSPERTGEWWRRVVVIALGVAALLQVAAPAVDRYVGFSGVLHGLFLLALLPPALRGDRLAMAGMAVLLGKLALEMLMGGSESEARLIGGAVVTQAHLFGTLAALVYGLAAGTFRDESPA